jgi:5-methyltetrahydropteroyltriglutamate--homocysteine methyltransferase
LIQATRDLDRGRTTPERVAEQLRRDREAFVAAQEAAGFELLSDGLLDWQDLFRPLAESCDGLEARPLTRFLDTNTFFRALIVSGTPRLREPIPAPSLPAGRWVGTLPSPYALTRAADGATGAQELAGSVLAPQIEAWAAAGAGLVVLDEPFLPREPEGLPELAKAVQELPATCPLVLRLVFGDAAPLLPGLLELPFAGVGVDFYATSLEALPERIEGTLLAGVADVRSSALEDPQLLARFSESLAERAQQVLLAPNGDLQFVPEPIAREKVARLGAAATALREAA